MWLPATEFGGPARIVGRSWSGMDVRRCGQPCCVVLRRCALSLPVVPLAVKGAMVPLAAATGSWMGQLGRFEGDKLRLLAMLYYAARWLETKARNRSEAARTAYLERIPNGFLSLSISLAGCWRSTGR